MDKIFKSNKYIQCKPICSPTQQLSASVSGRPACLPVCGLAQFLTMPVLLKKYLYLRFSTSKSNVK